MPTKVKFHRLLGGIMLSVAALLGSALPASAHVTVSPAELPAEGYAKLDFSVPHGCEASPTTSISVQMPDQVVSATPQVVPGWTITTKEGELSQPVDSHGETITTGVREVTWRGGPLDAHQLEVFGLSVRIAGNPGDEVPFKVVQRCRDGQAAWIEVAASGDEEPEYPAPIVTLTAATDDGHGHADSEQADADAEDADSAETAAAEDGGAVESQSGVSSGDDGDGPLPVIALVISIVALLTAGAALVKRRA